jgi:hypothetical protein
MGHVIPQALPGCTRTCVVQRKDIDNFYGTVAEAHFGTLLKARGKGLKDIMHDPSLQRRLKPQLLIGGKKVDYYPFRDGNKNANHARLNLQTAEEGKPVELVIAMKFDEVVAAEEKEWGIGFVYDCRLAMVVTMIKAAFLTMFRLHGYQWAYSSGGLAIGFELLGRCYWENHGKEPDAVQAALKEFFLPYKHLVRPVNGFIGDNPPRGTLEDYRSGICFGSSGRPFAQIIYIRIGEQCHGVLMPGFENHESAATYLDFLKNDNETLMISDTWFNHGKQQWEVNPKPIVTHWPKHDESFEFG